MPCRIIFHAGFHKTGTKTVQYTLRENRVMMKPHTNLRLRWHMRDLMAATRGYSTWRDPLELIKAQDRFDTLMQELPHMPRRTLILSAEELCGHLPGRGDLADYSAAPILLYAFWEIAQRHFPHAEKMIYLTTRSPAAWLESTYWEHVKSSDMTMSFDTFRDRYHGAADLNGMADEIASRVPCALHRAALEDCKDLPHGPADPLFDLCDLPLTLRTELVPQPLANKRPDPAVLQALLAANRAHSNPIARTATKKAILEKVPAP